MIELNGKKIKFLTTTGRLDTDYLVREVWINDSLVAILENVNEEWLISFTNENQNSGMTMDILKIIYDDFQEFLGEDQQTKTYRNA